MDAIKGSWNGATDGMTKDKILTRMELLKKENDEDNAKLINLNQIRETVIQEMLVRNGRILELERILSGLDSGEVR